MAQGRRRNRRNKTAKPSVIGSREYTQRTLGLVAETQATPPGDVDVDADEQSDAQLLDLNEVPNMTEQEIADTISVITTRYQQAKPTTEAIAVKMNNWEKQYQAIWQDKSQEDEEHIYLAKTRELVQVVHAFLVQLVSQLPTLVTFQPMLARQLKALDEEWGRAKIGEALVNYYMDDLWKFRVDLLPPFIKTFLKYSLALIKVSYVDDDQRPDLKFEVVDRAFQYIDPYCHDCREAKWWIEKTFVSLSEVEKNFQDGTWVRPEAFKDAQPNVGIAGQNQDTMARWLGERVNDAAPLEEDELVEVWYYYQPSRRGRDHKFATMIGGEQGWLVWFGDNPWPYKGIPFRGKSYDPHEWQIDGNPLVEMYRHVQEMLNTVINIRLDDARNHTISPVFLPEKWFSSNTKEDLDNKLKFVRLNDEYLKYLMQQQGSDVKKAIFPLPVNTSSEGLFNDVQLLLGQGKEISNVSDVFRGQAPQKQATLGEIQEVLNRNQGVFKPVFMQLMRLMEEIAEIALMYFRDPEFFGEERIFAVVGKERYAEDIKEWHLERGNVGVRKVAPDEMDIDVTINAVNTADALMARTFRVTSIQNLFAAMGQVPELFGEIKDRYKWDAFIDDIFNFSVSDISSFKNSPEEVQRKAAAREKSRQQQLQEAARMVQMQEGAKAQAKTQGDIATLQAEASVDSQQKAAEIEAQKDANIEENIADVSAKHQAKVEEMRLEFQQMMLAMRQEFALELKALKEEGKAVSVSTGSNRSNTSN